MNKTKEAPLAAIGEKTIAIEVTFNELQLLKFNCEVLKDFLSTKFINLRKLHKNSQIISEIIDKLSFDAEGLNERGKKVHAELERKPNDASLEALLEETIKLSREFTKKKHTVNIYPIAMNEFPEDREKFGKKTLFKGQPQEQEVEYFSSFIELIGTIIPEEELV